MFTELKNTFLYFLSVVAPDVIGERLLDPGLDFLHNWRLVSLKAIRHVQLRTVFSRGGGAIERIQLSRDAALELFARLHRDVVLFLYRLPSVTTRALAEIQMVAA